MKDTGRVLELEQENKKLKEEAEMLFQTVVQLKNSLNLLLEHYVVSEKDKEVKTM